MVKERPRLLHAAEAACVLPGLTGWGPAWSSQRSIGRPQFVCIARSSATSGPDRHTIGEIRCCRRRWSPHPGASGVAASVAEGSGAKRLEKRGFKLRSRPGSASPTGSSNGRRSKDRRKSATGDTEGSKGCPKMERKQLAGRRGAARRIGRRFGERQRSKEADRRIRKRQDIGPSNMRSGVWGSVWFGESTGTEFDAIRSGGSEPMPEKPPTMRWIWKRSIVRNSAEEVAATVTIRSAIRGSGERLGQID